MQHRQVSLRGYDAGEDGRGLAHVAEVILCDMGGLAQQSHSLSVDEEDMRWRPLRRRLRLEVAMVTSS